MTGLVPTPTVQYADKKEPIQPYTARHGKPTPAIY